MRNSILLFIVLVFQQYSNAQASSSGNSNIDTSAVFTCAYLDECSLTTSNSSKIWCTELSLKTIILANYSFPVIADSSTFVNRENYFLSFYVNASGKIDSVNITGCSNAIVKAEILKAIQSAAILFSPAKDKNASATSFVYFLKFRSFVFSRASLQGVVSPQQPKEISEEEFEQQGKSLRTYRMN
jgi:hypothetical protein